MTVLAAGPARARNGMGGPFAAGRSLRLDEGGPVMQPVNAPARMARVAVVPASGGREAWGYGYTTAAVPGHDRTSETGQGVFLRYTPSSGWQVHGPPVDESGRAVNPGVLAMAMASNGEGWAVGFNGQILHRPPGGPWRIDWAASGVSSADLHSVWIGEDERGVYGFAVGAALTFLRLDAGVWSRDAGSPPVPARGPSPDLVSVSATSRSSAWAVSGANSNSLQLFERSNGVWARKATGNVLFDAPPAPVVTGGANGTVNQFSRGSAVAATDKGVWVTGSMLPVDALQPVGPDRVRPFALRYDRAGDRFTSFCPPLYQLSGAGVERTVRPCDEAFPFATQDDLPVLAAFGHGDVVAGGLGFFRFSGGRWTRLPQVAGYATSGSFASATEGWLASDGVSLPGGTRLPGSSSPTLGHWTTSPAAPSVRRWPVALSAPLEAVAGGLAVGQGGVAARLTPDAGWEPVGTGTSEHLHSVAWASPDAAFAVGARGTILRYAAGRWSPDPASQRVTSASLYGVAFAAPDAGWAVGAGGVVLRFDGRGWHLERSGTSARLAAVAVAGGDVVAAGESGTILVRANGRWATVDGLQDALRFGQLGAAPHFLAVAGLPDGTVLVGGARALVERPPGGSFRLSTLPPLDGSIHALSAGRADDGTLNVLAAVGVKGQRHHGDNLADSAGWLYAGSASGWRDVALGRVRGSLPDTDAPALRDPAWGVFLEPGAHRGWAVGGFPKDGRDEDGHVRFDATGSVWRVALDGDPPASPSESTAEVTVPEGSVGFAFLGDTACASGLCAAALGTGSRADVVALEALRSVRNAARDGAVTFVVHGGDARRNGLPDELHAFASLLDDVGIPVYGALGDKDLFSAQVQAPGQGGSLVKSNGYYQSTLSSRPAPWGTAKPPTGFRPVRLPGAASPAPGRASTHYAFDVENRLRVVVLDTSQLPLAASAQSQNPAEEQVSWLQAVVLDARAEGLPVVVAMHQPVVLPADQSADASLVTAALVSGGASAVLASHRPTNEVLWAPDAALPDPLPIGVFGGGGSPLAGGTPARGAYHAWQLVTVETDPARRSAVGRAPVGIRSIPVLESLALAAPLGRSTAAGGAVPFEALGRLPDAGGAHSDGPRLDPLEGRATYLRFPFPKPCAPLQQPESHGCRLPNVLPPDYRFVSEDRSIGTFVREDPARPGSPYRDADGRLHPDPSSGLFCAFKPGRTAVRVESGDVAARVPVAVTGGSGPCLPGVVADEGEPTALRPPADEGARPAPPEPTVLPGDSGPGIHSLKPRLPEPGVVVALAPPMASSAPAPPGGGAGETQEEREAATERADMTALAPEYAATAGLGAGVAVLIALSAVRRRARARPAPARVARRHQW